jgi:hypothetical protein
MAPTTPPSNLLQWGYLVSLRRGPEGGGRALAHYTVARPSVQDLQPEVTEFVNKIRARDRLDALLGERAGVTNADDTRKEPGVTNAHDTRKSGVTCASAAGVTCVTQSVTSKRGTSSKERANAPTLPLDADATDPHKAQRRQPLKPESRKCNGSAAETEIALLLSLIVFLRLYRRHPVLCRSGREGDEIAHNCGASQ